MVDTFHVRRDEQHGSRSKARDDGSSLIEQLIAISVIVAVLLGLLAALGATATSISTGRQRTLAIALAKQAIENLQGAAYTDVATNLSSPGLSSDPLVSSTILGLQFEGELLVAGSSTPYLATKDEAGTTFSLRTFVTAATPTFGAGPYRRITVVVDWNTTGSSSTSAQRTMRFSSLVFPLDYTSYPASNGSAEAIGGAVTVTGTLAGEEFKELRLALPGAHATTDSSTLRTSIASAAGSTSTVTRRTGEVATVACPLCGDVIDGESPRETAASVADNDTGTNTGVSDSKAESFSTASISTPRSTTVLTQAGTMASKATVAACAGCEFGDADALPWSEALLTASGGAITFRVDDGFRGTLWDLAGAWSQSAKVEHDTDGGGVVNATADLTAPAARVFDLAPATGIASDFAGAVRVSGFTASASVTGGYTTVVPDAAAGTATVEIWDGSRLPLPGYQTVVVAPGTSVDREYVGDFTVGVHNVVFRSRVQSQPATSSTTGVSPRSHGVAQLPSVLLVTVVVTVTTTVVVEETAVTSVEPFTIVFDYGRVSAGATWLVEPT